MLILCWVFSLYKLYILYRNKQIQVEPVQWLISCHQKGVISKIEKNAIIKKLGDTSIYIKMYICSDDDIALIYT